MTKQETRALIVLPIKHGEARISMFAHGAASSLVTLEVDGKCIALDECAWNKIIDGLDRLFALIEPFADDVSTHGSGGNDAV